MATDKQDVQVQKSFDGITTVTTEEELNRLLDGDKVDTSTPKPKGKDDPNPSGLPNLGEPNDGNTQDDKDDDAPEGDDDKVYNNVVEYLNEKHKLGLNIEQLPADLSREQEGEVVSDLFEKMVTGANRALAQYKHIDALLKDEEIAMLIKAKSEGKGLADLFTTYSQSANKSDEQLVFDDLKSKFPKLSDETINSMVSSQKKEGKFAEMANAIREQNKENDLKSEQQRLQKEQADQALAAERMQEEVKAFQTLVTKVTKVSEVPFTDDMKEKVLGFVLQADDEGESPMDKALKTDVGVLRAALGMVLLEELMGARESISKNVSKKKIVDRLLLRPEVSNAAETNNRNEIPNEVFDRF